MKTILAVLLLSALSLTACSKQVAQPAVSQKPKRGYELAKTWDDATMKAKNAEAEDYYIPGSPSDFLAYEICLNQAQGDTLCQSTRPSNEGWCATRAKLGPKHIAQCDKLIDELPKLIETRNAARKEELSK